MNRRRLGERWYAVGADLYRRDTAIVRGSDERALVWCEWLNSQGAMLRRQLVDVGTGEVLDAVWLDEDGRTRSYDNPRA